MNLHTFRPVFLGVSVLGAAVLILVNLSTWFAQKPLLDLSFEQIFFGVFLTWAYTIVYLQKKRQLTPEQVREMGFFGALRHYLGHPPKWLEFILAAVYLYAFYCLFLWINGAMADPTFANGQYTVFSHGKVTVYTEAEYRLAHRLHLRSITGFFLVFFAFSVVMLRPGQTPEEM